MIDLTDIVNMLANSFFGGNVTIAGILTFTTVLAVVFVIFRSLMVSLIVSMPLTLVFNQLGVISQDMMILLIIVAVLGLAMTSRSAFKDK